MGGVHAQGTKQLGCRPQPLTKRRMCYRLHRLSIGSYQRVIRFATFGGPIHKLKGGGLIIGSALRHSAHNHNYGQGLPDLGGRELSISISVLVNPPSGLKFYEDYKMNSNIN